MLRDLALSLATSLIEKGAGRLRDWAFGDAETRALCRAWEAAFETMLTEVAADRDQATLASLDDIFTAFIRADGVADLLLDLALSDGEPPLTELAARFEAQGFNQETLPVDFRAALEALTRSLSDALTEEAGEPGSPLYNRVSLGRLFVLQALLLREKETLEAITAILHRLEAQGGRTIYNIIIQQARGIAIGDGAQMLAGLDDDLRQATMEAILRAYRTHLRRTYAELNLRGLRLPFVNGHLLDPKLVHIPLDSVYIKLHARPWSFGRNRPQDKQALAEHIRYLHKYKEWLRAWEGDAQIVDLEEAIQQHDQVVILGPPGAGKSTFLQHLAWAETEDERIPLLVPLGRLDAALEGGHRLLDAALDFLTGNELKGNLLRIALEQAIAGGKVLWLWDALDEVRTHRREVIADLGALAAKGYPMVITSRPLSYAPIRGLEAEYDVLPLQAEEARAFVERWFRALAEAKGKGETWAEERQQWMEHQLDERPGLREVARNPLMLTFLAVLAGDDPRQNFPRRRKELYARFIERLITSWEAWKRGGEKVPLLDEFDKPKRAKRMALWGFRRIALHLHLAYTTGRVEEALQEETQQRLVEAILARRRDADPWEVEGQAEAILEFWQRAGLLDTYTLRGVDYLAFRHLTFQEYGAARALAEAYGDDPAALWTVLELHLLEEEWAEVIPLTLAHLKDATPLVARLLAANAEDEAKQRPLFRAAAALAEGANVAENVKRQVIDGLARLARTRAWWEWWKASAGEAVAALGQMEAEGYAADLLLTLTQDRAMDARKRVEAAKALADLGRVGKAASILLDIAQDTAMDADDRVRATKVLADLGCVEEAILILHAIAQDGAMTALTRVRVAEALSKMGRVGEAISILLAIAQDRTVDAWERVDAARALAELGLVEEAIPILLDIAQDREVTALTRIRAAEALSKIGHVGEAIPILRKIVQDRTMATLARVRAAEALGKLGHAGEVIPILRAIAQDGAIAENDRVEAAGALGWLGSIREATSILHDIAQDGDVDAWTRVQAAYALGWLGYVKEAVPILRAIAQDEAVHPIIRGWAADTLHRWGYEP